MLRRGRALRVIIDKSYPYLLIAPAMVFLIAALFYPLIASLNVSFYSYSPMKIEFIGLENYRRIFSDPTFWDSLWVTSIFAAIVVVGELLLGLLLASILNRELRAGNLLRSLIMLPLVLTPVAVGLMFRFMYNPDYGIFNYFLSVVGLPPLLWAADTQTALLSVALVDIWQITPYPTILFLAGLKTIPREQYEAAEIDGASRFSKFVHVTLPWLTPMIVLFLIIRTSDAFQIFDLVFTITGGGPGNASRSLSMYAFITGWSGLEFGYASAVSYVIVAICMGFAVAYVRVFTRKVEV